ncbi:MAG: DUF2945 domain-containing protein [Proteobacteria bacterium]|nr:MAG: DUF2945 domain-containing protein [Pseudomonadota bacterium]
MTRAFKIGDHVSWNSEAGRVAGTITKVHGNDLKYKGYTHHASPEDPHTKSEASVLTWSLR